MLMVSNHGSPTGDGHAREARQTPGEGAFPRPVPPGR